jgi:hypothetical protein
MRIKFSFCYCYTHFPHDEYVSSKACIVKDINQTCLLRKNKSQNNKKEGQKKQKMKMELKLVTLGDWFLNSPIMQKDGNFNVQNMARKNAYFSDSEVCSLSLEQLLVLDDVDDDFTILSSECYSFSSKKLLKNENIDVKEMRLLKSLSRKQSSKMKKSVSFRLPEVSDVIILHPS